MVQIKNQLGENLTTRSQLYRYARDVVAPSSGVSAPVWKTSNVFDLKNFITTNRERAAPVVRSSSTTPAVSTSSTTPAVSTSSTQNFTPLIVGETRAQGNVTSVDSQKLPKITNQKTLSKIGHFNKTRITTDAKDIYQLHDAVKDIIRQKNKVPNITLFFDVLDEEDSRSVVHKTIQAEYVQNTKKFVDRVNEIARGDVTGSDAMSADSYSLVPSTFDVVNIEQIVGFGNFIKKPIFPTWNERPPKGYKDRCVYWCLDQLGIRYPKNKDLSDLTTLTSFLEEIKSNYSLLLNHHMCNDKYKKWLSSEKSSDDKRIVHTERGQKRTYYQLKPEHFKLIYKYKADDEQDICILFDPDDKHYTLAFHTEKIRLYASISETTLIKIERRVGDAGPPVMPAFYESKYERKVLAVKEYNNRCANADDRYKQTLIKKFCFFDYETIIDWEDNNVMKPYSISYIFTDKYDDLEALEHADKNDILDVVNKYKRKCKFVPGFDCTEEFYQDILKEDVDSQITFISFNGANFDHFLLAEYLMKHHPDSVSNFMYTNNGLLNFKINYRHDMFDIRKHLTMGSLSNYCNSFKIKSCAKGKLDHTEFQRMYDEDEDPEHKNFINFISNNQELKEYNNMDVLSMIVLMKRYVMALESVPYLEDLCARIESIKTIGSLSKKMWGNYLEKNKEKLKISFDKFYDPKDEKKNATLHSYYKDMMKYKVAGRCEMFNGPVSVRESCMSLDACSMYPYQMVVNSVYFPHGKIIEANNYNEFIDFKARVNPNAIGYFYCDIDQSALGDAPKIYPVKGDGENIWGHNEVLKNYFISSVMIDQFEKYGCSVVIRNGFYFEKSSKGTDMFEQIAEIMKLKNDQDQKKAARNNDYNPSLRETLKLLMNALTGKVIEGLHCDSIEVIKNVKSRPRGRPARSRPRGRPARITLKPIKSVYGGDASPPNSGYYWWAGHLSVQERRKRPHEKT